MARRQLTALGIGRDQISWRLRMGRLHRIHAGVYAVGHSVISLDAHRIAAVLAAGDGAVLSHRSAAALWRIRRPSEGPIDVTVGWKSRSTDAVRVHCSVLPSDEITERDGIPVTIVPRTIFDFAADASVDQVEQAMREAEYRRLYDSLSLWDLLERYPGRRGARKVRICLGRRSEQVGRTRSPLEEVFVPFLRRHRLPLPRLNAALQIEGRWIEVDCLWERERVVVELDGFGAHGTRSAFREDRARDRRLRAAGYGGARIAWGQLEDEPAAIAADLRMLLGA